VRQNWNDLDAPNRELDVELEPVVRLLETIVETELFRAMRQQEPLRT
jgi:hypothetical protein